MKNKRLTHRGSNRLFASRAKFTKRINKQKSMNTPGSTRL